MPRAEFFTRFGLYVAKGCFDSDECQAIRSELALAQESPGTIVLEGDGYVLDASIRNVRCLKASPDMRSRVHSRLEDMQPLLAQHFGVALKGFDDAQFLCYNPGDFFSAHQDSSDHPNKPDFIRERKVSVVLFLNTASDEPESGAYVGGSLTFYGLVQDARWQSVGFDLVGEEGLLIAFRSDLMHEVTPVTHGQRYTLVTWYY